jgi:4-hydroxy-3-methylbut-2-en-1-yl diphosphate reductase
VGTMAVAPEAVHLVERATDVDLLPGDGRAVALLSQTTLGMREWADVRDAVEERFPGVWMPTRSDLCFATTNRQTALEALAGQVDAIVVIGSQSSSNTNALERVARESGCMRVERIDTVLDLPGDLHGTIGVTAGASVPEQIVDDVLRALDPADGVEALRVTDEDEYFPLPAGLRNRIPPEALAADRYTDASAALAKLTSRVLQ